MPSRWRERSLGELIALQRGYDLPEKDRKPGTIPVCGSAGINGYHNEARASGPGVTIGRSGASMGVVNYYSQDFWPHNTVLFVTDFKGNDPRFIAYLLSRLPLADLNSGAAQPSLNRNFVYGLKTGVPDVRRQRRIAEILAAYDDLIENNTRRIAILEEMARRLFEHWFVEFEFPGARGLRCVDTEIGATPEGWEVAPVKAVVAFDPPTPVAKSGEKPFVPMAALSTSSMVIDGVERRGGNSGSKFRNGDTLLARITPCLENGKTGYVAFLEDGETAFGSTEFIVLRGRRVSPEFVYLLARSARFREHAIKSMSGATGRQRVRSDNLQDLKIAVPPPNIDTAFRDIARPMFRLIHTLHEANRRLRAARDLLLPKLISGEIEVGAAPIPEAAAAE